MPVPPDLKDIVPVILCGGPGRRLRPLSRRACPKPFLKLGSRHSMLQQTLLRVRDCGEPVMILNREMKFRAARDLAEIGIVPRRALLEPCGRNTAPAIAAAALLLGDDLMLVLPSDHWIRDTLPLKRAIAKAAPLARAGWIVSFGIHALRPETGFGYIRRGAALQDGVYRIDRFVEKPPRALARGLIEDGACDWNSGMFLISSATAVAELRRFEPAMVKSVSLALEKAGHDSIWTAIGDDFADAPSLSIDIALMERSDKSLVIPVDMEWSDLGTWPALLKRAFA
jgi:mannose-1-phosphate guanylyltransferase/mannose-6-phosphate isomerase